METARLVLRLISEDDASFILELLNEPAYIKNIGDRGVRTEEDARAYIQAKLTSSYDKFGYGLYLVSSKIGLIPIGISGFVKRDSLDHADLGFAFKECFWKKGYAREAAEVVIRYGRSVLGFTRILGIAAPHNIDSIKLLEKVGLHFENSIQLPGVATEQKLFSSPIFNVSNVSKEAGK